MFWDNNFTEIGAQRILKLPSPHALCQLRHASNHAFNRALHGLVNDLGLTWFIIILRIICLFLSSVIRLNKEMLSRFGWPEMIKLEMTVFVPSTEEDH